MSEFFKGDRNLNSLKNSRVYVFQIARENILLFVNNIHEKMIKNHMFRRHLRTKLRHLSIVSLLISIRSQFIPSLYLGC